MQELEIKGLDPMFTSVTMLGLIILALGTELCHWNELAAPTNTNL